MQDLQMAYALLKANTEHLLTQKRASAKQKELLLLYSTLERHLDMVNYHMSQQEARIDKLMDHMEHQIETNAEVEKRCQLNYQNNFKCTANHGYNPLCSQCVIYDKYLDSQVGPIKLLKRPINHVIDEASLAAYNKHVGYVSN